MAVTTSINDTALSDAKRAGVTAVAPAAIASPTTSNRKFSIAKSTIEDATAATAYGNLKTALVSAVGTYFSGTALVGETTATTATVFLLDYYSDIKLEGAQEVTTAANTLTTDAENIVCECRLEWAAT